MGTSLKTSVLDTNIGAVQHSLSKLNTGSDELELDQESVVVRDVATKHAVGDGAGEVEESSVASPTDEGMSGTTLESNDTVDLNEKTSTGKICQAEQEAPIEGGLNEKVALEKPTFHQTEQEMCAEDSPIIEDTCLDDGKEDNVQEDSAESQSTAKNTLERSTPQPNRQNLTEYGKHHTPYTHTFTTVQEVTPNEREDERASLFTQETTYLSGINPSTKYG